ncbi:MAG: hypothetical protein H7Z72_24850, partial [Bacteroidetes bacterium]|nr:hypothetical protein [Fibrella sp.]
MKQLCKSRVLAVWMVCLVSGAVAQPVVSNIRVETDSQRVKITYDVAATIDQDSLYLQVESRTRGVLKTKTVTGDVGKHITPGANKVMYWDYALDGERVDDEIRPTVGIVEPLGPLVGGGPTNALLSVLLPGVGNALVQPKRKIGWRPLITAAYAGPLVYGLVQKSRSNAQYALYNAPGLFERDAQPYYDEANRLNKNYVRAIRAAALVLMADVIYTVIKGTENVRQIRKFRQGIALNYIGNTPA